MIDYKIPMYTPTKWWTKILLFFKPMEWTGLDPYEPSFPNIGFKVLNGRVYILKELPPKP